MIQAARGDKIDGLEAVSVLKRSNKEKKLEDWEEKVLYGQYLRQTKEVSSDQCWAWLQNGEAVVNRASQDTLLQPQGNKNLPFLYSLFCGYFYSLKTVKKYSG